MNLLIKGISISLLFLIGAHSALAKPGFGGEPRPIRHGANYQAGPSLAAHHGSSHYGRNDPWPSQGEAVVVNPKASVPSGASLRPEENRLSPEQRRALRHEIREVSRELYRQK